MRAIILNKTLRNDTRYPFFPFSLCAVQKGLHLNSMSLICLGTVGFYLVYSCFAGCSLLYLFLSLFVFLSSFLNLKNNCENVQGLMYTNC